VAVQMDGAARLDCGAVLRGAADLLRIPEHSLQVSKLRFATFLVRFEAQAQRNAALGREVLVVGRTRLHLMPWTRQFGASACRLFYRVRVCIEGVPPHAEQMEVVSQLFDRRTFVECVDHEKASEDERACFCIWVRTGDPDAIPRDGTLQLEEPPEFAEEVLGGFGDPAALGGQDGPARLLDYKVFLHVDRVLDYSSPPTSSYQCYESAVSGIPDDEPEVDWPVHHLFVWRLGVPDGYPVQRRVPVQEHLGERRRDRSPPGGGRGGRGDLRLRQFLPSSMHDFARGRNRNQEVSRRRYGGNATGYHYTRAPKEDAVVVRLKKGGGCSHGTAGDGAAGEKEDGASSKVGTDSGDSVPTKESEAPGAEKGLPDWEPFWGAESTCRLRVNCGMGRAVDPMQEEAALSVVGAVLDNATVGQTEQAEHAAVDDQSVGNEAGGSLTLDELTVTVGPAAGPMVEAVTGLTEPANGAIIEGGRLLVSAADAGPVIGLAANGNITEDGSLLEPTDEAGPAVEPVSGPVLGLEEPANGSTAVGGGLVTGVPVLLSDVGDKEAKDAVASQKLSAYTKKLQGGLLATPIKQAETASARKKAGTLVQSSRKITRLANKLASGLTMEEQATALLIKKSSFLDESQLASAQKADVFCSKFADPMPDESVTGYRVFFGIENGAGTDLRNESTLSCL